MGIQTKTEVKFQLIQEAVQKDGNELNISALCKLAGVSRSGYYSWLNAAANREAREEQDRKDFQLIRQAYEFRGYPKGAQRIYMRLLHLNPPVIMNPKKIRRLMEKYGLHCPDRKDSPHPLQPQSTERKTYLADITALPYPGGTANFASLTDLRTREILTYDLSAAPQADFILKKAAALLKESGTAPEEDVLLCCGDGALFTAKELTEKLREADFEQVLRGKGNYRKGFFGVIKQEIAGRLAQCFSLEELRLLLNDWVDYYNNDRYQWDLEMLSPREYGQYLLTGVSPVARGISKNPEALQGRNLSGSIRLNE